VQFRDKRVHSRDVRFSLLDDGKMAGIYLFIPGFREDDVGLQQIGYLMLDEALGEYDVESRLGLIQMLPLDTRTEEEQHPLAELPSLFDRLVLRLRGALERPLSNTMTDVTGCPAPCGFCKGRVADGITPSAASCSSDHNLLLEPLSS
jgi:hypothetical protein